MNLQLDHFSDHKNNKPLSGPTVLALCRVRDIYYIQGLCGFSLLCATKRQTPIEGRLNATCVASVSSDRGQALAISLAALLFFSFAGKLEITGGRDSASGTRTEVPKLGFHRVGREISHALLKRAYVFIFSDFVAALWIPGLNGGKDLVLFLVCKHNLTRVQGGSNRNTGFLFRSSKTTSKLCRSTTVDNGSHNVSRWMTWLPISLKNAAKCDKWYQLQNLLITESLNANGTRKKPSVVNSEYAMISVSNKTQKNYEADSVLGRVRARRCSGSPLFVPTSVGAITSESTLAFSSGSPPKPFFARRLFLKFKIHKPSARMGKRTKTIEKLLLRKHFFTFLTTSKRAAYVVGVCASTH